MEGSSSTTGRSEPAEGAGPGGSADQWEASALLVVRQGSRWRGRDDSCSADQWEASALLVVGSRWRGGGRHLLPGPMATLASACLSDGDLAEGAGRQQLTVTNGMRAHCLSDREFHQLDKLIKR